tara:strand:+ start:8639 stop:9625 length:987 start_codon:yes stop_codon:yes gene_type:complete
MSTNSSTNLKGFTNVFQYTLNNDILDGIIEFFDWGLLGKGNYFNVSLNEEAPNGEDYSRLRPVEEPRFSNGQAWEGFRGNWVWQTGISYSPSPITTNNGGYPGISGVYVNDSFHAHNSVGTYAHHVDYDNGRIVFDSPIPTGSKVQAEYSYKWINVTYACNLPWIRQLQQNSNQPDTNFIDGKDSDVQIPPESKIQLPTIAVEVVPTRRFKGYQLGGGQLVYTDVIFHCIAEDEITRNALVDMVSLQNDKTIQLFNTNKIHEDGVYPLNYQGSPVLNAKEYPELVISEDYNGGRLRLTNAQVQGMTAINSNIYGGIVRMTTEGIKANI